MYKTLFALFMLPVIGMLLLVGVIVEPAQAQAPALAASAAPRAMPPSRAGDAVGGPYEPAPAVSPVVEAAVDSNGDRWRIVTDPELERRFALPRQRRLNNVTLRF